MEKKCPLRKYFSCSGGPTHDQYSRLRDITPVSSPQDSYGPVSSKVDQTLNALDTLQRILLPDESTSDEETTEGRVGAAEEFCNKNVPLLGQVFEKVGGSANGQKPGNEKVRKVNGAELCREVSGMLKGVGQLHYVGAFLVVLGFALDRFSKASKYSETLCKDIQRLRDFGRHVWSIYGQIKDCEDSELAEPLQRAMELVCKYATFYTSGVDNGKPRLKKPGFSHRFFLADTDLERLACLKTELDQLYAELTMIGTYKVYRNVVAGIPTRRSGENFILPDATLSELVGTDKQVEEASIMLNSLDLSKGVHAFVLVGAPGSGKGVLGQQVAAKVKREKQFDKNDCCKVDMYNGKESECVTKKQQELYAKLSRGEERKFSALADGKLELEDLFRHRDKPSLIYFHNAHEPNDLRQLLPDALDKCLCPGSILVVTTANEEVISALAHKGVCCSSYRVRELDEEDARTLLMKQILRGPNISPNSHIWSKLIQNRRLLQLLTFCNGVPLLLIVVGSYIWSQGHEYLRTKLGGDDRHTLASNFVAAYSRLDFADQAEFLNKLETAVKHVHVSLLDGDPIRTSSNVSTRLRHSLQFTCDQLGKYGQMKEFFLDIVAVHLWRKCKDVELICREEDAIHMNTLKQMSMVKHVEQENSDGSFEPVVQVHGLLVGEVRRMDNTSEPGRRMVVDSMNRAPAYLRKAKDSSVYAQPETVKLNNCGEFQSEYPHLHLDMINVRYLELLGTNIRMCNGCREVPSSLKFLRVRRSCLPFPLEGLRQLVFLDVDLQMDLIHNVESIQSMPKLQELKLANSVTLEGIGPLWKLRTAHVKNCPNFEEIKEVQELTELRIVNCPKFRISCMTGFVRLKTLSLVELGFKEFPEARLIPPEVESVDLSGNINLKEFPMFAKGNAIKKLNLRFCLNLELRWDRISSVVPILEELYLGECMLLNRLPSLPEHLPKLKILDVRGCRGISRKDLSELVKKTEGRDPPFRILGGQVEDEDVVHGGCLGRKCESVKSSFRRFKHGVSRKRRYERGFTYPVREASMEKNKEQ